MLGASTQRFGFNYFGSSIDVVDPIVGASQGPVMKQWRVIGLARSLAPQAAPTPVLGSPD
jgi:hypothetical protein